MLWSTLSTALAAALPPCRRATRVAIVGDASGTSSIAMKISTAPDVARMDVVAVLDRAQHGDMQLLDELVADRIVDVVITPAPADPEWLSSLCMRLADHPVQACLAFPNTSAVVSPFDIGHAWTASSVRLLDLLPPPMSGARRIMKRCFDLLLTVTLLLVLSPLLVLVAFAIYLDSRGPVLFRQWRFGEKSQPVLVYKFRTMRTEFSDVTGSARTVRWDPRVTRVGRVLRRLSVDELPQLLNVLRGEMSLVGPRPHATHMKVEGAYYFDAVKYYHARHRVLPGITGWAQINGSRGEIDTLEKAQKRVKLDLWYVANWSPALDLLILIRTGFGKFATLSAD